jgi:hypothetical protein
MPEHEARGTLVRAIRGKSGGIAERHPRPGPLLSI